MNRLNYTKLSNKNKIIRTIWIACYVLFFRIVPTPFHGLRCFVLRMFGAKVGKRVHVYPDVSIWAPWNLEIDDYSCLGRKVVCYSVDKVIIGRKVVVSQGSHLCTATHDYTDRKFPLLTAPIVLKDEVWLAAECFVGPGVVANASSMAGSRAVVTKDMEENAIYTGNPAEYRRKRYQK